MIAITFTCRKHRRAHSRVRSKSWQQYSLQLIPLGKATVTVKPDERLSILGGPVKSSF